MTALAAMHRLGLADVQRVLVRRRAARRLGKPQTDTDRFVDRVERTYAGRPEALRRVMLGYLQKERTS